MKSSYHEIIEAVTIKHIRRLIEAVEFKVEFDLMGTLKEEAQGTNLAKVSDPYQLFFGLVFHSVKEEILCDPGLVTQEVIDIVKYVVDEQLIMWWDLIKVPERHC